VDLRQPADVRSGIIAGPKQDVHRSELKVHKGALLSQRRGFPKLPPRSLANLREELGEPLEKAEVSHAPFGEPVEVSLPSAPRKGNYIPDSA